MEKKSELDVETLKKVQFSRCEKMMVTMTKRGRYMWVGYTPEEEDTMGKTHTLSQTQL